MRITTRTLSFISQFNTRINYYEVLNLRPQATDKQIKTAFRQLARKYHPDSNKGQEEKFKEINEAYQVLSCHNTKRQYDAARKDHSHQNESADFNSKQSQYQPRGNPYRNTYRGYQAQEDWENPVYRKKVMDELFQQQQNREFQFHQGRQFRFHQGSMSQQKFDEILRNRIPRHAQFHEEFEQMQRDAEKIRVTRQQVLRANREEQLRREREYKQYKDQSARDLEQQIKDRAWKMAEGIKKNVNGAIKVGKYVKSLWDDLNQSKKK